MLEGLKMFMKEDKGIQLLAVQGALGYQAWAQEVPEGTAGKVEHQFQKLKSAWSHIVGAVVNNGQVSTHSEWEDLLAPSEGSALTQEDNQTLVAFHSKIIQDAAAKAKDEQIILIDEFHTDEEAVHRFCLEFPRAALLHIHPCGTMKQDAIDHLLREINPVINTKAMPLIGQGEPMMAKEHEN